MDLSQKNIGPDEVLIRTPIFEVRIRKRKPPRFVSLYLLDHLVTDSILDVISIIELLKAFAGNKLTKNRFYHAGDLIVQMRQYHGDIYLCLEIGVLEKEVQYLDKTDCLIQAAKLQKLIGLCDAYQYINLTVDSVM